MFDPTRFPRPTRVPLGDVELEVIEAGPRDGAPVVLCHGWPEHAFSWRHQVMALADAGHHVLAPTQRGYGRSSRPEAVEAYDIAHLTGDLVALLDHHGHDDATVVGHDWGANVVWGLALLHPDRVRSIVALSLPYQERGDRPWVEVLEELFGRDHYMVHVNRRPGVADALLDANAERFLRNVLRGGQPATAPGAGTDPLDLATAESAPGTPLMGDDEMAVYLDAYEASGFTGGLNWYRNLDRNWHLLADVDPVVRHPALMIYGERDVVPPSPGLAEHVPAVEVMTLDAAHCIQQERPAETTEAILGWLERHGGAAHPAQPSADGSAPASVG